MTAMNSPSSTNLPAKPRVDFAGAAFVLVAAMGFSAKAIFIKLANICAAHMHIAVAPSTLLIMRMATSVAFFLATWLQMSGAGLVTMGVLMIGLKKKPAE